MGLLSKRVIFDNWDNLISDLQGDVVIYSRSILTDEEYSEIEKFEDEREIIRIFLNVVVNKSDEELIKFVQSLRQYYPWLYEGLNGSISHFKQTDTLNEVKILGGIPNLPQRMIQRNSLLFKLKERLMRLDIGDYLVLHGMLGSGKTTLAAAALYDKDLVTNYFKGSVYWLTVGKLDEKDIIYLFQELNERLPEPLELLSPFPRQAAIQLTKRLIEKGLSHSLIVLDDVKSKAVLDCFAIGAKLLVITEDKGIVGNKIDSAVHCIKVEEGFDTSETLELFSKSLNIKSYQLPEQASEIHKYTKGHPLTVSLIASQLESYKDSVLKDNTRWDYYIKMLSNKKFRRRSMNDFQTFYNAIQGSVESLDKKIKHYFLQLAVFVEDVNIKPEVLGTLWNLDKYEAEEVMLDFVRKSLAVKKWNEVQNSYVYGVHDLVCDFLKKDLLKEDEEQLHKHFISNYEIKCGGVWCELPKNDNYIFYYIGYHLRKAGHSHHSLFQKLYFSLAFLETKLRVCGPADLIRDFKNYKELITEKNNELEQKAAEFYTFIEYHGVSITKGIDIIQAALQEPTTSSVHVAAVQLAKSKQSKQLYLHSFPLSPEEKVILPETLDIKEEVNIVCFGSSVNEIIVASGRNLKLYNIRAKGVIKDYKGHNGKISTLDVCDCRTKFLSASHDNTVRIWSLENGKSSLGDRTPSPVERQSDYISLFTNANEGHCFGTDKAIQILQFNYPLLSGVFCKWSHSMIATLGTGFICVLENYEKKWEVKFDSSFELKCLDFFYDGNNKFIVAGGNDKLILYFLETGNVYQQQDCIDFISLRSLPVSLGGGLVELCKHKLTYNGEEIKSEVGSEFKQLHSVGSHIAVTTKSGELFVFHFFKRSIVARFPMSGQARSICINDRAILLGYSDGSICLDPLEQLPSPLNSVKWKINNEPILIKMDRSQENIEVVIGKKKPTIVEISTRVKIADISSDGKAIAMVLEDDKVVFKSFHEDHVFEEVIIEHYPAPTSLFLLENNSEQFVITLYKQRKALLWKVKAKKLVELNDIRSVGCRSASLLQLKTCNCLITASPMSVWTLEGHLYNESGISGIQLPIDVYCVSPNLRKLVYIVEDTCYLKSSNGEMDMMNRNVRDAKLVSLSPSAKILAILDKRGILTVFNCETKKLTATDTSAKDITCLAVSDSGSVCFGGSNNLSIVTKASLSSKIVLNTRSIVSEPNGEDKFAVADNSGIVYIVYLDIINGECSKILEQMHNITL